MATITGGGGSPIYVNAGSQDQNGVAQLLATSISNQLSAGTLSRTSPTVNPSTGNGFVNITVAGGQTALAPANSSWALNAGGGSATVVGNGGLNQQGMIDNTNTTFYSAGGTGTVIAGDGNNLLGTPTTGGGGFLFVVGNGNDTITAASGNNTVFAGTGRDLIGSGYAGQITNNVISVQGPSSGSPSIVIGAGLGTDTIYGGTGSLAIAEGAKNLVFVGGSGPATIYAGTGSYTINAGTGGGLFAGGTAGNNWIATGTGTAGTTIFGGGNGDLLQARGTANNLIAAGTGNETLTGALPGSVAGGNNTFYAGSGNNVITAGNGNDTIFTGSGNATVTMGAGKDLLATVVKGAGQSSAVISVNNFVSGTDKATFLGNGSTPTITTSGASSSVTLTDGTKITFNNVIVKTSDFQ